MCRRAEFHQCDFTNRKLALSAAVCGTMRTVWTVSSLCSIGFKTPEAAPDLVDADGRTRRGERGSNRPPVTGTVFHCPGL